MLILDEADRILDLGFSEQLSSILSYLPRERQTLLFSATQTKSVKDLARLSLNQPEYLAVHTAAGGGGTEAAADGSSAGGSGATPVKLSQHYMVLGLEQKLDALYSFIKAHLKAKTVVFFATCSQVLDPRVPPNHCASLASAFACGTSRPHQSPRIPPPPVPALGPKVRFAYECLRTLQPGVPLLALHGKHKQARRTLTYMNFLEKARAREAPL